MRLSKDARGDVEKDLAKQDVSLNALSLITGIDLPKLTSILSGEVKGDPRHLRMIRHVLGEDFEPVESEVPEPETTRFRNNRPPDGWKISTVFGADIAEGDMIAYFRNSGQLWVEVTEITDDERSAYRGDPYVRIAGVEKSIRLASDRLYRIARKQGA